MPIQYEITSAPTLLHVRVSGNVASEEYFEAVSAWLREDAFHPSMPVLFEVDDTAEFDVADLNLEEAEERGQFIRALHDGDGARVAFAGGDPDLRSFMVMAQEILNDGPEVRSFDSLVDARRWLLS